MSDLRDALEKLIGERVEASKGVDTESTMRDAVRELRELLAAHPVEPECQGDGVCTNPNCPRHGIEWTNAQPAGVSDEAVEDLHARVVNEFRRHGQYTLGDARAALVAILPHLQPQSVASTSLGLTRAEIRDEVDELIRNAYAEGWREAKQRPDVEPPVLEIDWTQPGGVRITELWCLCDVQGSALSTSCKVHGGAK